MDRNVKIAIGCGGAGCLGLIVVIAAGGLLYFLSARSSSTTNRNSNYNANRSSGAESPENRNDNRAANDNESSSSPSSSLSEDTRHKLFHAASMTRDTDMIHRVGVKIGILNSDYTPKEDNVEFATEHVSWVFRNTDFIQSVDTPAKARAYVNAHIND